MNCPKCQSAIFCVKDPEDEYEVYEFEIQEGEIVFDPELDSESLPEVTGGTNVHCIQCSWQGQFSSLSAS